MRKVQIQNMEHEASEHDVVVVAHDKDGQPVVHIVKPGRVANIEIEARTFMAVGDHRPEWLINDLERPKRQADPAPAPSAEDVAMRERNAAWLAAGEALGWPAPDRIAVVQPAPLTADEILLDPDGSTNAPPENPQFTAEEQEALKQSGVPAIEPNRIPFTFGRTPVAPADPLDHDGDGKKGGSKAKKTKG